MMLAISSVESGGITNFTSSLLPRQRTSLSFLMLVVSEINSRQSLAVLVSLLKVKIRVSLGLD